MKEQSRDVVKVEQNRDILMKKYKQSFTEEVFFIHRMQSGITATYNLVDMVRKEFFFGSFYGG